MRQFGWINKTQNQSVSVEYNVYSNQQMNTENLGKLAKEQNAFSN